MPFHRPEHRPVSIAGSHWRADGQPKMRYETERQAMEAAELRGAESGVRLGTYRCAFCAGWHMGRRTEQEPGAAGRPGATGRRGTRRRR